MLVVTVLTLAFTFVQLSFAQPTSTEGWQFNDNSRSSWDILWTCISTIFACTWTALHLAVPHRSKSSGDWMSKKVPIWIYALLAPEMMTIFAISEFRQALHVAARCNAAFENAAENSMAGAPNDTAATRSSPTDASHRPKEAPHTTKRWKIIQGYCLNMRGVVLVTKDEWTYPVLPGNVVDLIQVGVVKHSHLRDRDIERRAKADTLAKAFALLQALWVTVNIIARAAYHLPISPLEISTVAYVACAAIAYAVWWHKPKDMETPIQIFLPYDRESVEMPSQVRDILDERWASWVHVSESFPEDSSRTVMKIVLFFIFSLPVVTMIAIYSMWEKEERDERTETRFPAPKNEDLSVEAPRPAGTCSSGDVVNASEEEPSTAPEQANISSQDRRRMEREGLSVSDNFKIDHFGLFMALLFCGIHIAAYVVLKTLGAYQS